MVNALERFSPLQEEVAVVMEAVGKDEAGPKKVRIAVRHTLLISLQRRLWWPACVSTCEKRSRPD